MKRSILQYLADSADLAGECLPGQTLIELLGDNRVLIENHGGITQYGTEQIQVQVRYGSICVSGKQLKLCQMNGPQLVIMGCIESITLLRRGK